MSFRSIRQLTFTMFGYHCSIQATLLDTVKTQHRKGINCLQCYIGGNQTYTRRSFKVDDLQATRDYLSANQLKLYTHSCLCMNLASGSLTNVACLNDELKPILATGGSTVVHIGSRNVNKRPTGTLDAVVETVKRLAVKERQPGEGQRWPLLLENAAGEGARFGSSLNDLEYLFRELQTEGVGFCLDTAHAYGAGVFDFSDEEGITDMFNVLDDVVGVGRLQLIHLNDSKIPFGGRNDRHECLGVGHIWRDRPEPLKFLLQEAKRQAIDVILETPDVERDYLFAEQLLAGQ